MEVLVAINLLPFLAPDQPGLDASEKISCGYQALSVFSRAAQLTTAYLSPLTIGSAA